MRRSRENRKLLAWIAAGVWLLAAAAPATVVAASGSDEWKFDAAIYLWAPSMDIKPDGGDSIHISFSDIMKNLDMTFMGMLGARKGKWSLLADVIYMDLQDDQNFSTKLLDVVPVSGDVDVQMEAWIVTAAGGYNLVDTGRYTLDLLAGARYISVELPLQFKVTGRPSRKTTPSGDIWDGIIGVRGEAGLTDNWYINYYLDGGTGDSSFTWQALTGLNYRFKKFEAGFGYRYLTWRDTDKDIQDLTVKGPYAGVRFLF